MFRQIRAVAAAVSLLVLVQGCKHNEESSQPLPVTLVQQTPASQPATNPIDRSQSLDPMSTACSGCPQSLPPPVTGIVFQGVAGAGPQDQIDILSEGYNSKSDFEADAKFFFDTQLMSGDAFYKSHASSFLIKTLYREAPSAGGTLYGISTANRSSCNFAANPAGLGDAIQKAASAASSLVVVLANDSVSFACTTTEEWTYLASGAADRTGIMAHELGHLIAGLFDENSEDQTAYTGDPINRSNCSTQVPPQAPYWMVISEFELDAIQPIRVRLQRVGDLCHTRPAR